MTRKRLPLLPMALTITLIALLVVLGTLQAQAGSDSAAAAAELEVVASGLANPRGQTFGPDGALYISEAGSGGAAPCFEGPEGEACYGATGAVTKVSFDGDGMPLSQEQIVTGLASIGAKDTGDNATGPNDIAFTGAGDMYVLMGLGADPALRDPAGPLGPAGVNFGQLISIDSEGNWSNEVDIAAHEAANNPDGAQVDSNPFALLASGSNFRVIDAGGNDLLSVDMTSDPVLNAAEATISTVAVFPARMVEFPPGSGEMMPMDAVPTAVEMGPDGAYYVGQLTGFPFPVGGSSIFRVVPGEEPEIFLTGFTNVMDLAFGPDGSLFVLEMAKDSLLADPPPVGQIIRVAPYGARTVIASDGLIAPVDMEIGPDHALYVANLGTSSDQGQIVRIDLPVSTATLSAAKDNTLYESLTGAISNGAGQHFFAGVTASRTENALRRGVIAFDLSGELPAGAAVLSAELELNMSRTVTGDKLVSLHKLEKAWGEGTSDAQGEEGAGAMATPGDATWLHSEFDTQLWASAGGDFSGTASASTMVGSVGKYSWSSDQLTADVQSWVDGASANYGWLLMGDESGDASAKRFDSRENPEEANRPKLVVRYVMPLPDHVAFAPVVRSAD